MRYLANMEIETNVTLDIDTGEVLVTTYTEDNELIEDSARIVDLVDEFLESMVYDHNGLTKSSYESVKALKEELMDALALLDEELGDE
jgi:hypothetical protein